MTAKPFTFTFYVPDDGTATAYQNAATTGYAVTLDAFGKSFDGLRVVLVEKQDSGYLVTMSGPEAVAKLFSEISNSKAGLPGFSIGATYADSVAREADQKERKK